MTVLSEMLRNLVSRPSTTRYPAEKVPIPGAFRGRVECDDERCIGCSKCSRVCPASAITMAEDQREVEFGGKTMVRTKKPRVVLYRCIRCGLCERHCPADAIHLRSVLSIAGPSCEEVVA
jgi:formate hydrogenlyase subunit 6/NADH:ubiquinone oxidoreductase subunit I